MFNLSIHKTLVRVKIYNFIKGCTIWGKCHIAIIEVNIVVVVCNCDIINKWFHEPTCLVLYQMHTQISDNSEISNNN